MPLLQATALLCTSGRGGAGLPCADRQGPIIPTIPLPALQALPTLLSIFDSFTPKHERINKDLRGGFLRNLTPPLASYYGPAILAW